jgi:hypothetical protein
LRQRREDQRASMISVSVISVIMISVITDTAAAKM